MSAILTAWFCLHGICLREQISTPISFTMEECAKLPVKPTHGLWRLVAWTCDEAHVA